MKNPASPDTRRAEPAPQTPLTPIGMAARALAGGLESVGGVMHGALGVAGRRAPHLPRPTGGLPDGRSSRWAAHRAARRDELIDAAIAAVITHGASVGMNQIAAAGQTSKPVIYRYFTDKTDLYRAISQRVVGEVLATLVAVTADNTDPRELIHAGIDAYLVLLEENPELYRFVSRNPVIGDSTGAAVTDFSAVVAELLSQHLETRLRQIGLDPAVAQPWGAAMVGFVSAASLWWLDHRADMSREDLGDYLSALLWGGAAGIYHYVGEPADPKPSPGVLRRLKRGSS